jgi:hypothetical protein
MPASGRGWGRRVTLGWRMPEEVRFFARSAIFGLVVGAVYWFLSYDAVGTVLLVAFGLAGLFLTFEVRRESGARAVSARQALAVVRLAPEDEPSTFSGEGGWLPGPTVAPLALAAGVALALLSIVFGPAMLVAAAAPVLVGVSIWIRAAVREWRAAEAEEA